MLLYQSGRLVGATTGDAGTQVATGKLPESG
jgi:hypothetical protein